MKKSVLVLHSGGIDSTVLLKHYLDKGWDVKPLFIAHDQPRYHDELEAVSKIVSTLGLVAHHLPGGGFRYQGYFGPARNAYLLIQAVNYASVKNIPNIAIGISHGEYLDTRPEFIDRFNFMLDYCLEKPIYALAPFAHWSKEKVIKYGLKIDAPLRLTTSCMNDPPCGKCQDCKLRKKYEIDDCMIYPNFTELKLETIGNHRTKTTATVNRQIEEVKKA